MAMVKFLLRLDQKQYDRVQSLSRKFGLDKSSIIRLAITSFWKQSKTMGGHGWR